MSHFGMFFSDRNRWFSSGNDQLSEDKRDGRRTYSRLSWPHSSRLQLEFPKQSPICAIREPHRRTPQWHRPEWHDPGWCNPNTFSPDERQPDHREPNLNRTACRILTSAGLAVTVLTNANKTKSAIEKRFAFRLQIVSKPLCFISLSRYLY